MSARSTLPAALVVALAATPATTPATDDDGDDPDRHLVSGDGYTVVGALSELPGAVDEEGFLLVTADVAAAAERAGLERPVGEDDAVIDWFGPLTGAPLPSGAGGGAGDTAFAPVSFVPPGWMIESFRDPTAMRDALGWATADVDAFATSENPPRTFTVIAGDLDDDMFPAELPEVADDIVTVGAGDDLEPSLDQPSPLSRLGVPQRMTADDGRIAFGPVLDDVAAWIDDDQDDGRSAVATDDEAILAVAEALDAADVVAAVVAPTAGADPGALLGTNASPEVIAQLEDRFELAASLPLDVVGIGWSTDEQGAGLMTVAYHVAAGPAEDLVDGLTEVYAGDSYVTGEPISAQVTLEAVEASDDVVVATLRPADGRRPLVLYEMLLRRDTPFAVGPG